MDLVLVVATRPTRTPSTSLQFGSAWPPCSALPAIRERNCWWPDGRPQSTLAWLERHTASRTRALIEERGLRAATRLARSDAATATTQRPPTSVLGALLDRDGPESFGDHLARLADAAIVDTRVLLAHRLGADEAGWPSAEDRFASDLLLAARISDPWLRALTTSAAAASIPILLGGHTLVGPGVRLIMGGTWI